MPRNFHDVEAVALFQASEKGGLLGVPAVGGDPFEVDAVGLGTIEQFQGEVMLGPIDDVVGNAGLATTFAVVAPAFGQEEFGVEHGAEARVEGAEGELDRDDTVGGLAEPAAILPLHAGSHLAGFGMAGVVEDAEGLGILMIAGDELLNAIAGARVIPDIAVEKLLEGAGGDVVEQRDGLDALALQVAELPAHIMAEMFARLGSSEAVGELVQKLGQGWCERKNLIGRHP